MDSVFVNPRPNKTELYKYYESQEYISHSGTNKGIVNFVYTKIRKYTHSNKVKLVKNMQKEKTYWISDAEVENY